MNEKTRKDTGAAAPEDFAVETGGQDRRIRLKGSLDLSHVKEAQRALARIPEGSALDLAQLTKLDTAGALYLHELAQKSRCRLDNLPPQFKVLLDLVAQAKPAPAASSGKEPGLREAVERLGKTTLAVWRGTLELITFLGQIFVELTRALMHPSRLRFGMIVGFVESIGINAIPIIGLVAFLISVVLAYQGLEQLRPLGAQHLTVNLIAISMLREMGVLLTSIMVAGRSGSAFTAEIGVMKVREEVDALQAIGVNPFEILVIPRIIALVIALPLLTFIANMLGLLGGGVISLLLIDMSLPQYLERVRHVVDGSDLLVGMIKAPVFALVIGAVGCMHGMKVSGSAESVGRETTASVVESIFLVLMLDAFFSIYFQKMGI